MSTSSANDSSKENNYKEWNNRSDRGPQVSAAQDKPKTGPMEVAVEHNHIERAMRVLKRKLIKEGIFRELKQRRFYEKPSERRKRKEKESMKKIRKDEARARKNTMLLS
jgi:small subunit ribosomal protein S21